MSYREENEQVILTMGREDYGVILMVLGVFTAFLSYDRNLISEMMNRLKRGQSEIHPAPNWRKK